MPDFTVDPADLRSHASFLAGSVAPTYATSAASVRQGSHVGIPGFGIALAPVEAGYLQRVDFLAKDLQGAHDLCLAISDRLNQTAAAYQRSENLNISGFGGTPAPQESYGAALSQTGVAQLGSSVPGVIGAGVTAAMIEACLGSMAACSALCPTFIPATIAAALFIANPIGIAGAGAHLINEGRNIQTVLDVSFLNVCNAAAAKWTGAGKDAFQQLATTVKGHLDQVGRYLETLGGALHTLDLALSGLWLALIALVGPFLVWLVAMRAAELVPVAAPAIEPIIEATGAVLASSTLSAIASVTAVGSVLVGLIDGLGKDLLGLSALPDAGAAGVPDLTEFTVDTNFQLRV
jgi:hypothetical protein